MNLLELQKPLPLKWRVQRAVPNKDNPTHVILIGYVDARDVQERLDKVCGIANWQTKYYESKNKQFCDIGIFYNEQWVWKGDCGTPSQTEKEKGETSDAFKRAGVQWGINRFAYKVGEVKLNCKLYAGKPYPCDENGNFLKGKALFDTCNKLAKIEEFEIEFDNMFEAFSNPVDKMVLEQWEGELKACTTKAEVEKKRLKDKPKDRPILDLFEQRIKELS